MPRLRAACTNRGGRRGVSATSPERIGRSPLFSGSPGDWGTVVWWGAGLKFDRCEFADRCLVDVFWRPNQFEWRRCLFSGRTQLTLRGIESGELDSFLPRADIQECQFQDQVFIEIQAPIREVALETCQFNALSETRVIIPLATDRLSFHGSRLLGQLKVSGPSTLDDRPIVSAVIFTSTLITGSLDLRGINFSTVDFQDVAIVGGGLELDEEQLRLANEFPTHGQTADMPKWMRLDQISRQYDMLGRALPRSPQSWKVEDVCVFRSRDFQLRANIEAVGSWRYWSAMVMTVILVLSSAGFLALLSSPWPGLAALGTLTGIAWGTWRPFRWLPPKLIDSFRAVWDRVVLQGMLGYGVRVWHIFGSALSWIGFFALFYWVSSTWNPDVGRIEVIGQNYVTILKGQAAPNDCLMTWSEWSNWRLAEVRDSFYYSVVTFTTLGYGDFSPQGRLRGVAACEALLGAVMIALMTVIFARKYLRL